MIFCLQNVASALPGKVHDRPSVGNLQAPLATGKQGIHGRGGISLAVGVREDDQATVLVVPDGTGVGVGVGVGGPSYLLARNQRFGGIKKGNVDAGGCFLDKRVWTKGWECLQWWSVRRVSCCEDGRFGGSWTGKCHSLCAGGGDNSKRLAAYHFGVWLEGKEGEW